MKTTDTEKVIDEIRAALKRGEAIEVRPLPSEPLAFELDLAQTGRILLTNWKKIAAITLLFAIIGGIGGTIYYFSSPQKPASPHLDMFAGIEINPEDDYNKVFAKAEQFHKEVNTYIDSIKGNVRENQYNRKKADLEYLTELQESLDKSYEDTFLLAKSLYELYHPVREKDIEKKLIELELRQRSLSKEIITLQRELSYLSSVAAAVTSTKGSATDNAIADGVAKARRLATYQQEYEENALLINELTGTADNSKRVQQRQRIDSLIQKGISANERFKNELNRFVQEYSKRQNISITVFQTPEAGNSGSMNYTVVVSNVSSLLSPFRIPKAITFLFTCVGFGMGCLWVLWENYRPTQKSDTTK